MGEKYFQAIMIGIAAIFTAVFCVLVVPNLANDFDVIGALAAGFVNPYSSGYSTDVILCWVVLLVWVVFDARQFKVKHGWVCVLLGAAPGVAVGLPLYILLRNKQIHQSAMQD